MKFTYIQKLITHLAKTTFKSSRNLYYEERIAETQISRREKVPFFISIVEVVGSVPQFVEWLDARQHCLQTEVHRHFLLQKRLFIYYLVCFPFILLYIYYIFLLEYNHISKNFTFN